MERVKTPGSHGDMRAGDEGLDDPVTTRRQQDDMSATPPHGDKMSEGATDDASEFSGRGGQKEGSEEQAEGTGYTEDADTAESRRENPLS